MKLHIIGFIALSALVVGGLAQADTWSLDDTHSAVKFSIKHMMISNVSGTVTGMKGTFEVNKEGVLEAIDATADPKTISTGQVKRDEHLKSPDFFDAAKFSTMAFKSKEFKKDGDKWKITGDLTMHGVTKSVTFDSEGLTSAVKDPWGNTRRGFVAEAKVNRKDWGLSWNKALETGGVVVGEDVKVTVETELVAPKAGGEKAVATKEKKKK